MSANIGIRGTGSYLPERIVSNAEIAVAAGVDPGWIESRTGIRERRRAAPGQATSDLAAAAADRALTAAGICASDLDHIIVATSTPDHPQPATASIVQHLVGARNAAAVDVNAVCSGFVYALAMAEGLLRTGGGTGHALVIGADIYSRILDYSDRKTAVLFGDGAGAVVLGPVPPAHGLIRTHLRGHGDEHTLISVPAGGSRRPATESTLRDGDHYFKMDGRGVRDFVGRQVPAAIHDLLSSSGIAATDVEHLVPHQANGVMLNDLSRTLGLGAANLHLTVGHYGNTGSASIPVTLDEAARAGRIAPGDLLLLAGFGGGMNLGVTLGRWSMHPPAGPRSDVRPLARDMGRDVGRDMGRDMVLAR
ncbi:ketoacyl-ACP synthase III [Kineosporia sp. NBRC 101731]|uniref:3-oxoacyl-ACP synthase III family protein n=1 Tax=Kineosporia sp. NBRC 101731 TaxID=3032199 RepID=UPI0024A3D15D|nr:ketoacyl-ACP synthase III [Kineosporia sp. NBRC 101731]GLY30937.1 3-oxoacyl-[acyl-carrier-protein] synthase 3 [Kineosporia sp. NBRC 101731]